MKIIAVLGSPRSNGNSAFIARHFLETARKLGAETQSFALNTLTYRGCQACRACKKTAEELAAHLMGGNAARSLC